MTRNWDRIILNYEGPFCMGFKGFVCFAGSVLSEMASEALVRVQVVYKGSILSADAQRSWRTNQRQDKPGRHVMHNMAHSLGTCQSPRTKSAEDTRRKLWKEVSGSWITRAEVWTVRW